MELGSPSGGFWPALTFAVSEANLLFTATDSNGVWESTNNGASWVAINLGLSNRNVHTIVISGNYLFAGPDDGIYRLQVDELTTRVDGIKDSGFAQFELKQNYPNPFNPTTTIDYTVSKSGTVTLKIYNLLGQEVAALFSGFQNVGSYTATFDGSKFASGVYLYRLQSENFTKTMKMVLAK